MQPRRLHDKLSELASHRGDRIIGATVAHDTQTAPAAAGSAGKPRSFRQTFETLRGRGHIGLLPFVPAGYPDLQTTATCLVGAERGGASAIEVGIPFSDPIADGPIVQEAFSAALAKKLKVEQTFETVASVRGKLLIPLVSMVSYSIVFRYGVERFVKTAREAGFNGLILPDLPPPEAQKICDLVQAGGLDTILLIAPTTSPERRREIARLSSGFIYYLSISGITGERDKLPADLEANLRQIRDLTDRPVCVGFGISRPEHVAQLQGKADGAIVGSGVVRRMKEHLNDGPAALGSAVERYTRDLLSVANR
jgi:tryptophan synthase alpha chain